MISNKAYNIIKWLITIGLPATGAFYWGLVQVWDFPRITGVNGTINLLIVFGGALIGYSGRQYKKADLASDGDLIIQELDGEKHPALGVKGSLDDLTGKDSVRLTVVHKNLDPLEE